MDANCDVNTPDFLVALGHSMVFGRLLTSLMCVGFLWSGVSKSIHFQQAVEENANYYHLPRPRTMAILQIAIVFIGSALVISGWCIWLGAGALAVFVLLASYIGHAFWKKQGRERDIQLFVFLNHFVIACALLFVAWENVRGAI